MGVHDREDARDANPLVNALPAQCTSRRKPRIELASVEVDGGSVIIDRKTVFAMKPETRAKWLVSALKYAALGEVRPIDVYDIIASNRFVEDLPPKVGRKMGRAVQEQMDIFSAKQKRFLANEAVLIVKFGAQENAETKMEDMMARCRAFVREKALERGDMKDKDGQAADSQLPSVAATDSQARPAATAGAPSSKELHKEDSGKDRGGREKGKTQQRSGRRTRSSSGSASSARSKAGGNKKQRVQRKRSRSRSSSSQGSAKKAAATAATRGRRKAPQHRRRGSSSSEERSRRRRGRSSSSEPSKKRDAKKNKKKQR